MSTRTLARRFASETGMSWQTYLHHARMMRAMELLSVPGATVTEAAWQVGFKSLGAFSRAFAEFTGERPSAFLQRLAQG